jgi:hypothetical protein
MKCADGRQTWNLSYDYRLERGEVRQCDFSGELSVRWGTFPDKIGMKPMKPVELLKMPLNLESISDGRIYGLKDYVSADSNGCEGCSACCFGVGELVKLTPFDTYEMTRGLKVSFDKLLSDHLELRTFDKITLPYLKMLGPAERCSFLSAEGRCVIHAYRPNICRMFPLGRVYTENDFKYFLQVDACVKPKLKKVKVEQWIGIENYENNKAFLLAWHNCLKALAFRFKFIRDDDELKAANDYLLETFYRMTLKDEEDFYTAFFDRLAEAKDRLGIIV